jgi:3-hydroxybutyryl-CoA dehydrogenase
MAAVEVQRIAVLGAGVMGHGMAQACATAGFDVVCFDTAPEALDQALASVTGGRYGFDRAVERGKLDRAAADAALGRLAFTSSFEEAVSSADLVLEAVPERLATKIAVFRQLDRTAPAHAILASNTSGLPIEALAACTDRPGQVVGWHWASPSAISPLAEIAQHRAVADETVATVVATAARCGKNPIVIQENPQVWGFVSNRVYFATVREAMRCVDEGIATAEQVNQIMVDTFRWPVGPLAMVEGASKGWQ